MKVFQVIGLTAMVFLGIGCGESDTTTESDWTQDQQRAKKMQVDVVMEIHDQSMERMSEIHQLKVNLIQRSDSTLGDSLLTVIEQHVVALEEADEAMMQWMRNYKQPRDTGESETAMNYLKVQEEKIKAVDQQMVVSMEAASNLLKQLSHEGD